MRYLQHEDIFLIETVLLETGLVQRIRGLNGLVKGIIQQIFMESSPTYSYFYERMRAQNTLQPIRSIP